MVLARDGRRGKQRGLPGSVVRCDKKFKVSQSEPGGSPSCDSDDDFISPPLAFLAMLQQDPLWKAPTMSLVPISATIFPHFSVGFLAATPLL
nr:uncharacterized protein LOC109193148 isoform X1 [Ipomoea batatas]